jgi:hypothetical protein
MNQGLFALTFTIPGTLAANHIFGFRLGVDATLIHVSLSNSSANQGTCKIGTSIDDDAIMIAVNFGINSQSSEAEERSEFVGNQWPRMTEDVYYTVTITDHASHMADVCVTLLFDAG